MCSSLTGILRTRPPGWCPEALQLARLRGDSRCGQRSETLWALSFSESELAPTPPLTDPKTPRIAQLDSQAPCQLGGMVPDQEALLLQLVRRSWFGIPRTASDRSETRRHPLGHSGTRRSRIRTHHGERLALRDHGCAPPGDLTTRPPIITKRTSSRFATSSSGSPSTATRSASIPGSMAPRSSTPRRSAA